MSLMGIPPESPDPSISDTAFVTEISDVGTVIDNEHRGHSWARDW